MNQQDEISEIEDHIQSQEDGGAEGAEEEEVQYDLNGQVVRKIQIEDDEGEYYMDD